MKNKKNTISINESQLRDMIAESVKKVLSELDWKTYQSAAEKSWLRSFPKNGGIDKKEMDRSERFSDASEEAFNKQHPRQKGHLIHDLRYDDGTHRYKKPLMSYYGTNNFYKDIKSGELEYGDTIQLRQNYDGKPDKGENDFLDFANGNTKYEKGKGWQLKESVEKPVMEDADFTIFEHPLTPYKYMLVSKTSPETPICTGTWQRCIRAFYLAKASTFKNVEIRRYPDSPNLYMVISKTSPEKNKMYSRNCPEKFIYAGKLGECFKIAKEEEAKGTQLKLDLKESVEKAVNNVINEILNKKQ